jgi:hypothetical protein
VTTIKRRLGSATLALALLTTVVVACTPGPTTPTPTTLPQQQLCDVWDKVAETPPSETEAVLVKDDVVALAEDTTVTGSSCTASNAKIALDGATLAEGEEVLSEQNNAQSDKVAAVTGEEIAAGEPVLENVSVNALSAELGIFNGAFGIRLRGNVNLTLSGVTSTIGFVGTLNNLDNWSIQLSSSALIIPGMTVTPVTFAGTLTVTNGLPSLDLTANASNVKIGDVSVTGAAINLKASPTTGVSASVAGSIKVGPTTATGSVAVEFDRAGALVSAKADIAAHLVGTQAGGKKIDLQGQLKIDGNAAQTAITFSASGIVGDLNVHQANGSLTLAPNKATFTGVLDVASGANYVRYNGTIVWDGITASTPFLQLEGAGEISGTLDDGSTFAVRGSLSTVVVGGQLRAVVEGDFQVGTLKASGSAIVETNGATTRLELDAQLEDTGFAADLTGVVEITDGRAELIELNAGVTGQVHLGDVTLSGANLKISSRYGAPLDIDFDGRLDVGSRATLLGSIGASFGPNGTLLRLEGQLSGSMQLDTWGIVDFSGSVVANPEQVTLTGAGGVNLTNFPLGIQFSGSFTSRLDVPTWTLNGQGRFRIASIDVATARLTLSQTAGMKATRVGFYFSIIGIPTYLEADFYLKSTGGCEKVNLTGGSFLARPIAALALPAVVGCPVYN